MSEPGSSTEPDPNSPESLFGSEYHEQAVAEAAVADATIRREVLKVVVPELTDAYKRDISYTAGWLLSFRRVADALEVVALILSALSSVFAYLAGVLVEKWWAFTAGILGTASFATMIVGRYCNTQSKERTQQLNKILTRFNIPNYPDVVVVEATDLSLPNAKPEARGRSRSRTRSRSRASKRSTGALKLSESPKTPGLGSINEDQAQGRE